MLKSSLIVVAVFQSWLAGGEKTMIFIEMRIFFNGSKLILLYSDCLE